MDSLTPTQRHAVMAANRSSDTSPERAVRSALHRMGFRFRKNDARLPGHPDIVFPHYHAIIFVNGCFWHGHVPFALGRLLNVTSKTQKKSVYNRPSCAKYRLPKTNTPFWKTKITRNRERDAAEIQQLLTDGWRVAVVWECSITGKRRAEKIRSVSEALSHWLEEGFADVFREF